MRNKIQRKDQSRNELWQNYRGKGLVDDQCYHVGYVVTQFYSRFKLYFLFFQTHDHAYTILQTPKQAKIKLNQALAKHKIQLQQTHLHHK